MLCFNVFWILILTIWGLIGIHTDKFGFKHVWEIWYDCHYGLPHHCADHTLCTCAGCTKRTMA